VSGAQWEVRMEAYEFGVPTGVVVMTRGLLNKLASVAVQNYWWAY